MANDTHCNLSDCWMGDNFSGQRRGALSGHGHRIEDAWGKASLVLPISVTTTTLVPRISFTDIMQGIHDERRGVRTKFRGTNHDRIAAYERNGHRSQNKWDGSVPWDH
jgi:hypothetical protein